MNRAHFENKNVSRSFFIFLWIAYALVYMTKNCFSAALASIVAEGFMTKAETGLITAVFYIIYAPLQIVGGIAADKYDPEKLIRVSLWGSAVANLVIFINQNYYVMLAAWAFNAIAQFAIWPAIFKIVSAQLVRSDRKSSAFYISFSSSGGLLLAFLMAAIISKWQYNFLVSSIILFALAVAMEMICKKVNRYFVTDEPIIEVKKVDAKKDGFPSTGKIFLASGFYIFVVIAFLRCTVELGIKALAPTMLMESYDGIISDSVGNIINLAVIALGILGTLAIKTLYSKKLIKTEPGGTLVLLLGAVPFLCVLIFIGKVHWMLSVLCLCITIFMLTGINLLSSYYNMYFAKYGKSGVAAGVLNFSASLGVVAQSYGIGKLADVFGWQVSNAVFAVFIVISAVLCLFGIHIWQRFIRKTY
ncbi:MAG: MFS transporter [Clostridia bacterium]|nr:MFS transporter [Clostridia bacterium]